MGSSVAQRSWAIEVASGLGHLLAQQLLAAGERVLDVQPKLAARVRLLHTGRSTRTTRTMPARWPSPLCVRVTCALSRPEDQSAVNQDLGSTSPRPKPHAQQDRLPPARGAPASFVPGSFGKKSLQGQATQALAEITPRGASDKPLLLELAYELSSMSCATIAEQQPKARRTRSPAASSPHPRDQHQRHLRCRPHHRRDRARLRPATSPASPPETAFAAYNGTAPIDVSSGNNNVQRLSAAGTDAQPRPHMAAVTDPATPTRGRPTRPQDRRGHEHEVRAARPERQDQRHHLRAPDHRRQPHRAQRQEPGRALGNDSVSSAAGHTPNNQPSDKPLPGQGPQTLTPEQGNNPYVTGLVQEDQRSHLYTKRKSSRIVYARCGYGCALHSRSAAPDGWGKSGVRGGSSRWTVGSVQHGLSLRIFISSGCRHIGANSERFRLYEPLSFKAAARKSAMARTSM